MPNRSSKRPSDLNKLAASIVGDVVDEDKPKEARVKDPAAVALGRKGGLKGGKARAKKLSAEERSAIAKQAAETRWKNAKARSEAETSLDQKKRKKHIIHVDHED